MFERYTENARRAIFHARSEAADARSPFIETEHLLLGVIAQCESEVEAAFHLKQHDASFRSHLDTRPRPEPRKISTSIDKPLSNECKRVLAYSAEEAERLGSLPIHTGHLVLGMLRECGSTAGRFLAESGIGLESARQFAAAFAPPLSETAYSALPPRSRISASSRYWIGVAVEIAAFVVVVAGFASTHLSGRKLLLVAAIWFVIAAGAWTKAPPFSGFFFAAPQRTTRRLFFAGMYAAVLAYHTLLTGWIVPLGFGLYRLALQ
jgi:hypothetical protein